MPTSASTLKFFRQTHLYIGIFIAPAILFFAFTGAMQTFSLHESKGSSTYQPPHWIMVLAQIHKNQNDIVRSGPPKLPKPPTASATPGQPPAAPKPPAGPPQPPQKSHLPLKIFFLLVSIGLFTSTLTGIYMAYKYTRNKGLVTGLLLAGIAIPLLLLPF